MNNEQTHGAWQASIGNDAEISEQKKPAAVSVVPNVPFTRNFAWHDKIVLLVDVNSRTREARSKMMRKFGVTVHCASTADMARSRMASGTYNLVLLDLGRDIEGAESLAQEIRGKNRRQRVGFLIGSPLYVATSLKGRETQTAVAVLEASGTKAVQSALSDFGQRVRDVETEQARS